MRIIKVFCIWWEEMYIRECYFIPMYFDKILFISTAHTVNDIDITLSKVNVLSLK